jgi:hypothetical protein
MLYSFAVLMCTDVLPDGLRKKAEPPAYAALRRNFVRAYLIQSKFGSRIGHDFAKKRDFWQADKFKRATWCAGWRFSGPAAELPASIFTLSA